MPDISLMCRNTGQDRCVCMFFGEKIAICSLKNNFLKEEGLFCFVLNEV